MIEEIEVKGEMPAHCRHAMSDLTASEQQHCFEPWERQAACPCGVTVVPHELEDICCAYHIPYVCVHTAAAQVLLVLI